MRRKKAQNSDVERGWLHGEIEVFGVLQISVLGEIFDRVQLVPFSFNTELIEKCSSCPPQI